MLSCTLTCHLSSTQPLGILKKYAVVKYDANVSLEAAGNYSITDHDAHH